MRRRCPECRHAPVSWPRIAYALTNLIAFNTAKLRYGLTHLAMRHNKQVVADVAVCCALHDTSGAVSAFLSSDGKNRNVYLNVHVHICIFHGDLATQAYCTHVPTPILAATPDNDVCTNTIAGQPQRYRHQGLVEGGGLVPAASGAGCAFFTTGMRPYARACAKQGPLWSARARFKLP